MTQIHWHTQNNKAYTSNFKKSSSVVMFQAHRLNYLISSHCFYLGPMAFYTAHISLAVATLFLMSSLDKLHVLFIASLMHPWLKSLNLQTEQHGWISAISAHFSETEQLRGRALTWKPKVSRPQSQMSGRVRHASSCSGSFLYMCFVCYIGAACIIDLVLATFEYLGGTFGQKHGGAHWLIDRLWLSGGLKLA